jgi:serine/threonine-protein kinase
MSDDEPLNLPPESQPDTPPDIPWDTVERLLPGALLDRRYQVQLPVGRDEHAARFAGVDIEVDEPIALDVMELDAVGGPAGAVELVNAVAEARTLHHPDLVPTRAGGLLDGLWSPTADIDTAVAVWLVSPLRAGGTLRQVLDRGRRLTPSQAVVVGFHTARALAALHERGLVHGEVSPRFVRFGLDQRAGLTGVPVTALNARRAWLATDDVQVERAWYAAPELALGAQPSPAADVYGLCLTLIEAVTGELPFAHTSTVATLGARVGRLMPVSADLGPLAAVLERAGRPDPDERSTAAELAEALVRCAENMPRPGTLPIVTDDSAGMERPSIPATEPDPSFAAVPAEPIPSPTPSGPVATPPTRVRRRAPIIAVAGVLAVAMAVVLAWVLRTPSYPVPDLVGRPAAEVANLVAEFDWVLEVQRERNDDVAVDAVIRTDPAQDTELGRGGTLVVVVSEGPTFVTVAEVNGLAVVEAFERLRQQGLVPVVTAARPDEEAPADTVLRWYVLDQPTLTSAAEVVKGTEIALEISQGPEPREVPDVVGVVVAEASRILDERRLVADLAEDFSDTVPVGDVVAQNPLPGSVVPRDSAVLVVVSKGPDVVAVPELEGLDPDAVARALADADLTLGTVTGDPTRRLLGLSVQGTPVRPGDQVRRQAAVALVYEFAPR